MLLPPSGPILTAEAMRAAERDIIARGIDASTLMERAGACIADAAYRAGSGRSVLVLAGPGNNGGDGYIAARLLHDRGVDVRVVVYGRSQGEAANKAADAWTGPVHPLADGPEPAYVLIDALFGTGLKKPVDASVSQQLIRLSHASHRTLAVDLPSGMDPDSGEYGQGLPTYDVTIALGALKPAHVLMPGKARCGHVLLGPIGIGACGSANVLERPALAPPLLNAHKYSRGMVAVVAGAMPGATALAASAAMRGGAGYVALIGDVTGHAVPNAVVRIPWELEALNDPRIGAIVVGPGLGRDTEARAKLETALGCDRPLVIDGDALTLLSEMGLGKFAVREAVTVLTPHAGEFKHLFPDFGGNKIEATREAAVRSQCVVIHKGPDTVIATPDQRTWVAPSASRWLATAGTGDVLAGLVGARLALGADGCVAAQEAVWLHNEAAYLAGPGLIADDLSARLAAVFAG